MGVLIEDDEQTNDLKKEIMRRMVLNGGEIGSK